MLRSDSLKFAEDVFQQIHDFNEISDEAYVSLYWLFSTKLLPALDLVEKFKITKYEWRESKRIYYQVVDPTPDVRSLLTSKNSLSRKRSKNKYLKEGEDEYYILNNSEFCPWFEHLKEVLANKWLMCKHILAVRIAAALKSFKDVVFVDDDKFCPLFMNSNAYIKQYEHSKSKSIKRQV